ncbi:MAG: 16S rRNA (cytidine(1402)-2'-O)-methyltransferase [Spirochaetae bacterium HGW-Spirochaetae-1]|jgi:16S rRNA (cytidine1402-2'-O)-methyltransferase|nr:MAG: 16S rRNA (cytidine(1402)-2'-O)-methyltransferase [Spirochaetae bacterium HGW-Spirochaetae-1]
MAEGTLYIIGTPIGNIEDITLRALKILKESINIIYCEDTRQSKKLLMAYDIHIPLRSLHAHSSPARIEEVCSELKKGNNIAYLTDSGTPALSDPGSMLVRKAREYGIAIIPLPGPSALATIISVAGFPEKNIIFGGFLSKKPGKRIHELEKLREFPGIIIIYESPYRIKKLLPALYQVFPGKEVLIGREMTKVYEEFISGTLTGEDAGLDSVKEKGEFTVAVFNN